MRLVFEDCGLPVDIPYETTTVWVEKDRELYALLARDHSRGWIVGKYDSLEKVKFVMLSILMAYGADKKFYEIPKDDEVEI